MATEIQKEKDAKDATSSKLDSGSKAGSGDLSGTKDGSTSDAVSCISTDAASSIKESEVDQEAPPLENSGYYPVNGLYGYYYPGFDGSYGEWDGRTFLGGTEGSEVHRSANQGDNGSHMYYLPGIQLGYTNYSPFFHGAMTGLDGQYMGQQLLFHSPMFLPPLVSSGFVPHPVTYAQEVVPAYPLDSSAFFVDGLHGSGYGGDRTVTFSRNNTSSHGHTRSSKIPFPSKSTKSTSHEKKEALPEKLDALPDHAVYNQYLKPMNKVTSISKAFLPINKISPCSDQGKSSLLFPDRPSNVREGSKNCVGTQNRGPRTAFLKSEIVSVLPQDPAKNENSTTDINKDAYNLPDFPLKYDHALFFVIKSYSEDDIHKSIKYNVWSSTPNGNKRLDNAFQVAQEKSTEKGSKCHVFLFFSVNASGQFCGLAEMIGRVDFNKNMDFWQQDKWNGYFPVKWHIIKDIPNPQFRHIILENNDNKPVTNSRDTQEVKFPQGTEMLGIFKSYCPKTSILDDFGFYDNRQKALQDKKSKFSVSNLERSNLKSTEVTEVAMSGGLDDHTVSGLQSTDLGVIKAMKDLSTDDVAEKSL
ncbi:uncharacterized protein [Typha latifolia]|uniref:uncharacterized protein n=1 Tax=Typha latifolia TaxID=4733 RepID=UPI003C2E1E10